MFDQLIHFLHMGGYAQYVWPAYTAMIIIFAINLIVPWLRHRHLNKKNK